MYACICVVCVYTYSVCICVVCVYVHAHLWGSIFSVASFSCSFLSMTRDDVIDSTTMFSTVSLMANIYIHLLRTQYHRVVFVFYNILLDSLSEIVLMMFASVLTRHL